MWYNISIDGNIDKIFTEVEYMAVDFLQGRIRKLRSPIVMDLGAGPQELPSQLKAEEGTPAKAYGRYCRELLEGLKELVPAVRLSFSAFALLGPEGMTELSKILTLAKSMGYYTLLDAPEILSTWEAEMSAQELFGENSAYPCDGVVLMCYLGTDPVKPFLPYCAQNEKDVFVLVRSGNRSAPQMQDLRIGGRMLYMAAADCMLQLGADTVGKYGYRRFGLMAAATSGESLRMLRNAHPGLFLLVEGYDYPNANAKNCAAAFDRMGYGCAVCSRLGVQWQLDRPEAYVEEAKASAERMKRSLGRYVTIL